MSSLSQKIIFLSFQDHVHPSLTEIFSVLLIDISISTLTVSYSVLYFVFKLYACELKGCTSSGPNIMLGYSNATNFSKQRYLAQIVLEGRNHLLKQYCVSPMACFYCQHLLRDPA